MDSFPGDCENPLRLALPPSEPENLHLRSLNLCLRSTTLRVHFLLTSNTPASLMPSGNSWLNRLRTCGIERPFIVRLLSRLSIVISFVVVSPILSQITSYRILNASTVANVTIKTGTPNASRGCESGRVKTPWPPVLSFDIWRVCGLPWESGFTIQTCPAASSSTANSLNRPIENFPPESPAITTRDSVDYLQPKYSASPLPVVTPGCVPVR